MNIYCYCYKSLLQPLKTTLIYCIHSFISGLTCSENTSSNWIWLYLLNAYFSWWIATFLSTSICYCYCWWFYSIERYSLMSLGVGHVGAILHTHIAIFPWENPLCEVWGFVGLLMGLVVGWWGFAPIDRLNKSNLLLSLWRGHLSWFRGF